MANGRGVVAAIMFHFVAAVAVAGIVAATVSGCVVGVAESDRNHAASELESTFATFEHEQVLLYENDGCRALQTSGGSYIEAGRADTCLLAPDPPPTPFDQVTGAEFDNVRAAIEKTGIPVQYAWFQYDGGGQLISAMYEVGCASPCEFGRFIYERGGVRTDPGRDEVPYATTIPLRGDWVWHEERPH